MLGSVNGSLMSLLNDVTVRSIVELFFLEIIADISTGKKQRERLAALEAQTKNSSGSNTSTTESPNQAEEVPEQGHLGPETPPSPLPVNKALPDITVESPGAIFQLSEIPFTSFSNDPPAAGPDLFFDANIDDFLPPGLTSGSSSSNNSDSPPLPNDLEAFLGLPPPSSTGSFLPLHFFENQAQGTNHNLASTLQDHQSSTFTFPDDHLIEVPTLSLLRAALIVATRLGVADKIWDVTCVSPFYTGPSKTPLSLENTPLPPPISSLPTHLHPTPTQRQFPHHPLLDLFPWPTVRDKLIQVFSVPAEFRPPAAADPLALINLVYDMEDPAEGMRVGGADPFEPGGWEIGQAMFEKWWWAFDGKVVEGSNRLRRERGQGGLVLGVVP